MTGLSAGLPAGRLLGGRRWLWSGDPRRRRLEFVEEIADLRFERQDSRFVGGDASIPFAATWALGGIHPAKVANSPAISCASFYR